MLTRSITTVLVAAAAVVAWPISFYPTNDCQSEPLLVLHEPPKVGSCGFLHEPAKSYSGGTEDKVQKILLYYDEELCVNDAAHRTYSNHTINNNRNECIPFKKTSEVPIAFTFIEEILPIHQNLSSSCNRLVVQI
ncbi:hypothetical protein K439DRAFT_1641361 [Ramaria rubella]|nr:hypothetical protein K439DRAFT_1641361 [Ramaria rubella]